MTKTRPTFSDEFKREAACFHGDTLVHTKDGLIEIQFVGTRREVLAKCEKTGEIAYRKVTKVFNHEDGLTYMLYYSGQYGDKTSPIDVTGEHPFWVKGKGWTPVYALQIGDLIEMLDGYAAVLKIIPPDPEYPIDVYNLEVEGFHTYFVGEEGLWVHNTKRTPVTVNEIPLVKESSSAIENAYSKDGVALKAKMDADKKALEDKLQEYPDLPKTDLLYEQYKNSIGAYGEFESSVILAKAGIDNVFLPNSYLNVLGKAENKRPDALIGKGETADYYTPTGSFVSAQKEVAGKSREQASTVVARRLG